MDPQGTVEELVSHTNAQMIGALSVTDLVLSFIMRCDEGIVASLHESSFIPG